MKLSFSAPIYVTGINPCVDVPKKISVKLKAVKGYIRVKGTINDYPFIQTLVPVKDGPYRLFVNRLMLKGSSTQTGDKASFTLEQDNEPRTEPFPAGFLKALMKAGLYERFDQLSPSRKKEILRYLNNLKTKESLARNIEKVILQLQKREKGAIGFLRAIAPPILPK